MTSSTSVVETYSPADDSSGYVPIIAMMRYGILLDLVGFVVFAIVVLFLSPIVFG